MTQRESINAMELAARERGGYYDPPWSLPAFVNVFLKGRLSSWARQLSVGARVLDIGCARGDLLDLIGQKRPDLELIGVDLSPGMTQLAKRRSGRLQIVQADGAQLPFTDRSFDLVVVMHLLSNLDPEHVAPALLREACRVSRSRVCAELKVPAILRLQLAIRSLLLRIPGARLLAQFLFAVPPVSTPAVDVYIHSPEVLLAGLEECEQLRPWPFLPTPTRVHVVRITGSAK